MEESEVIRRVRSGDVDAFGELVDAHVRGLRAFVALNAPVPHLIDEIAHEAFVFAFRNIDRFEEGSSFRAWLRGIAWTLLRAEVQRYSRERAGRERYVIERVLLASEEKQRQNAMPELEQLEKCLDRIGDDMRTLVDLRYRESRSAGEIASHLGRSVGWVRTTLCRIRMRLKECVEDSLEVESA